MKEKRREMVWSLGEKGYESINMQKYGSSRKFWKRQTEKDVE